MSKAYTTAADAAATIRRTLKEKLNLSTRDVSVTSSTYSMGSSIHVKIKNPTVALAPVEAIANGAESIRRDERTGDILGGGNRYVSVGYDRDAVKAITAAWLPACAAAAAQFTNEADNSLVDVEGTPYRLGQLYGREFSVWGGPRVINCISLDYAAQTIGIMMLSNAGKA